MSTPDDSTPTWRTTIVFTVISGLSLLWLRSFTLIGPSHERNLNIITLPIFSIGIVPYFASTTGLVAILVAAGMQTRRRVFFTASVWFYSACVAIGMVTFLVGLVWVLMPPSSDLDGPEWYVAQIGRLMVMISLIGALLVAAWAGLGLRYSLRSRRQIDANEIRRTPVLPLLNRWTMALIVFGVINFAGSHYYNRWRFERSVQLRKYGPSMAAHRRLVTCLAYSPDGKQLASAADDGELRFWCSATGKQTGFVDLGCKAADMSWTPDGESLIVGCGSTDHRSGELQVIHRQTLTRTIIPVEQPVTALALSPAGDQLAVAQIVQYTTRGSIQFFEFPTFAKLEAIPGNQQIVKQLEFSRNGKTLIVCDNDVAFWKLPYRQRDRPVFEIKLDSSAGAFLQSADQNEIFVASALGESARLRFTDDSVRSMFVDRYNLPGSRKSGTRPTMALTADQRRLFLTSDTKVIQLIDLPSNSVAGKWSENVIVTATAIAPDDETIAVGGLHTIRLYDTRTGELKRELSKNLGLEN